MSKESVEALMQNLRATILATFEPTEDGEIPIFKPKNRKALMGIAEEVVEHLRTVPPGDVTAAKEALYEVIALLKLMEQSLPGR